VKKLGNDIGTLIEGASIPEELRIALKRLAQYVIALMPDLRSDQQFLLTFMLERLVKDATDATVDTHWWEVAVDLIMKAASKRQDVAQPVAKTVQELIPLMRQHLGRDEEVSFQEITAKTVLGICFLSETLTDPSMKFVAPNAISLAEAHFNKHTWFRAIYAGRTPVGFVMLDDNEQEEDYFLWRFMIAEPYQGRGYGREALRRLVEYVKTRPGAKELSVSCGQGEGSPEGFYLKLGFVHTGQMEGDEVVLRLPLV
jgi:diamine N-acetyltransferase